MRFPLAGLLAIFSLVLFAQASAQEADPLSPEFARVCASNQYQYPVTDLAFSPNREYLLAGSPEDGALRLLKTSSGELVRRFNDKHAQRISALAFTPDGRHVLTGNADYSIGMWQVDNGSLDRTFKGHARDIGALAVSPDGRSLLSSGWEHKLILWHIDSGEQVSSFEGPTRWLHALAFSPDGRYALSGSWEGTTAVLWRSPGGEVVRSFEDRHSTHWSNAVAFDPSGEFAVVAGRGVMLLWRVETGEQVVAFEGHEGDGWVFSVSFSPDGRYLLSGGSDRTLRLWRLKTGEQLRVFQHKTEEVTSHIQVAFTPDGHYVLGASRDVTICSWRLSANLYTFAKQGG